MEYFLPYEKINELLKVLTAHGYTCLGPQVQNGAIVFDEFSDVTQLPWGVREIQNPGQYRLEQTGKQTAFDWANGPQAIKPILFKPKESLWRVERDQNNKLVFKEIKDRVKLIALFGARSCDIAAMLIQDKTFLHSKFTDKRYLAQRQQMFIIAVNCTYASNNCFCVSTNTGPKAKTGFDLALTEVSTGFVVTIGSEKGDTIVNNLSLQSSSDDCITQAETNIQQAVKMQTKRMPKNNSSELRDILMKNLDHERWDEVAKRCLSCGNCTSVCPTCFCHHETETAAIDGQSSEHEREWDSCFSAGHSYIHGKVIRDDTKSRYKQWLTHKLGTWWDQFDSSGCVGCGRCVTWCPVGIDITEEMAAISGDTNIVSSSGDES